MKKRFADSFFWFILGAGLLFLLLPALGFAQTINTWYPVEKSAWKVLGWDAVATLNDNDPLPDPADAALSYNVYVKNFNTNAVIPIASGITALECTLILPKRARYVAGVEAQLLYAGETIPSKSALSWSEVAAVCKDGQTFGLKFQTGPKDPKGLR